MTLTAEKNPVRQSIVFIFGSYLNSYLEKQFQFEMETSLTRQHEEKMELLGNFYILKNRIEVNRFLGKHKELFGVLFETYMQIKNIFGENIVELSLKLENDPEEDYEGLFVTINTNLSPEEALDLLERFDDEWFLDRVSGEISSIFTVTVRAL